VDDGSRLRSGRSRSPEGDRKARAPAADRARAPAADRASQAPVFIEPGTEGTGVKPNAQRVFDYLAHIHGVINDHADVLDSRDVTEEILRGRLDSQATDLANLKAIIAQADEDLKRVVGIMEANDEKLKASFAQSTQDIWEFLYRNNTGIRELFAEADASVKHLKGFMEEAVKDMAAARSLQPSAVAGGPKGLAFMSLRADLKKLEEKLDSRFTEFKSDLSDVRAAVNVASMSAGAAPPGIGVDGNAMQELEKLEEAMEERFAMIQGQIESLAVNVGGECPCVSGRCPCKCNGAPIKEPPKRREDDEDEFIKKDPWKRFARRGDGGGDGDGG
jgi:hypothetical protein